MRRRSGNQQPNREVSVMHAACGKPAVLNACRRPDVFADRGGFARYTRLLPPLLAVVLALLGVACSGVSPPDAAQTETVAYSSAPDS